MLNISLEHIYGHTPDILRLNLVEMIQNSVIQNKLCQDMVKIKFFYGKSGLTCSWKVQLEKLRSWKVRVGKFRTKFEKNEWGKLSNHNGIFPISRFFLLHIPTAWSTEIKRFIDRNFDQSGDGRETVNRG